MLHHFSWTVWRVLLHLCFGSQGIIKQLGERFHLPSHYHFWQCRFSSISTFLLQSTLESHLNNRVTRVFARLTRHRGWDDFCHLSEINNDNKWLHWERHDYLASRSRKVQSWPLANNVFCGLVLAHFCVQQQQQHLKYYYRQGKHLTIQKSMTCLKIYLWNYPVY